MDPNRPTVVARFLDLREAEMALSVLEGSGLEAWLDQPFTASIAPHYMFGFGGIALYVRERDVERAKDVLGTEEDLDDLEM
jgi:hypothetical protein